MMGKGLHLVFGGQWGSEGKGKVVGHMAENTSDLDAAISCFMPNAGHTYRGEKGTLVFCQFPVAAVNPKAKLLLGPTSALDLKKMFLEAYEIEQAGVPIFDRLMIDPMAVIITADHKNWESHNLTRISSTGKGGGAAKADKSRRHPDVILAKDVPELQQYIGDTVTEVNNILMKGGKVIGELAQGFELSLNHSKTYPYCTSRDCTPQQFLNDIGVHWSAVSSSIAVMRSYPIRVGNVYDESGHMVGYSGDVYADQRELDWDEMSKVVGRTVKEITTVTKKVRRVFDWSWTQAQRMAMVCRPTHVAFTFADYMFPKTQGVRGDLDVVVNSADSTFSREFKSFISMIDKNVAPVRFISTGADSDSMLRRF